MFERDHIYRRRDLHSVFGGQQQGGISTPAQHRFVMLFTSHSGEQHGYVDGWSPDGTFLYTGEGQHGDMSFTRGNAAIRDHAVNGKDLHLFGYESKGHVRYLGQMAYRRHFFKDGPDTNGVTRRLIVFELEPVR